jgi:hypothetical protein
MHLLDYGIRSQDQPPVAADLHHRRIVARAHQNTGGAPREARQHARQQGMFAQVSYGHASGTRARSGSGAEKGPRFAVWGGLLNLQKQVEPL